MSFLETLWGQVITWVSLPNFDVKKVEDHLGRPFGGIAHRRMRDSFLCAPLPDWDYKPQEGPILWRSGNPSYAEWRKKVSLLIKQDQTEQYEACLD